jgi:hypothetical protein
MDAMDSAQIFSLIEAIAAQPKKTEKIALLTGHAADESLRRVLDLALNPFARFGVRDLPARRLNGQNMLGDRHWALAAQLLDRELTGHAARDAIQAALDDLNAESAALFSRILGKDLRAGIGDALVNAAFPGLIPEFAYMRCSLPKHVKLKTWPWERGIYSAIWRDGDSTEQVKLKLKVQVELRVIGFNEGTGKNRGSLGSFQTASECGEVETNVNGRSTAMRKDVWNDLDSWRDAIICVDTNGLLTPKKAGGKHSLFLPIFVERRDDKRAADTLARIEDLIESAISA